jgi:hypothetical protein
MDKNRIEGPAEQGCEEVRTRAGPFIVTKAQHIFQYVAFVTNISCCQVLSSLRFLLGVLCRKYFPGPGQIVSSKTTTIENVINE